MMAPSVVTAQFPASAFASRYTYTPDRRTVSRPHLLTSNSSQTVACALDERKRFPGNRRRFVRTGAGDDGRFCEKLIRCGPEDNWKIRNFFAVNNKRPGVLAGARLQDKKVSGLPAQLGPQPTDSPCRSPVTSSTTLRPR